MRARRFSHSFLGKIRISSCVKFAFLHAVLIKKILSRVPFNYFFMAYFIWILFLLPLQFVWAFDLISSTFISTNKYLVRIWTQTRTCWRTSPTLSHCAVQTIRLIYKITDLMMSMLILQLHTCKSSIPRNVKVTHVIVSFTFGNA